MGTLLEDRSPTELTDTELVRAYLDGDGDVAFSELIRRHQIPTFRLLLGLGQTEDAAERMVERLFIQAAERLGEMDDPDRESRGWFFQLARELVHEERRRGLEDGEELPPLEPAPPPADAAPRIRLKHEVRTVLAGLPDQERIALVLVDLDGEPLGEVAQVLGCGEDEAAAILDQARTDFEAAMAGRGTASTQVAADDTALPTIPRPGTVVAGRFVLESLLGEGGMGAVYRAHDRRTGTPVAFKVLLPAAAASQAVRKRFQREARLIQRVEHDNFVKVIDHGVMKDGLPYIAMELLEGETLATRIGEVGLFSPYRALHVVRHVLTALSHAHGKGVVHRDVKPDNVMLVRHGDDRDFAKVLDLGIAGVVDAEDGSTTRITREGQVFGTPAYMAPEQVLGEKADERADLYSVTVMLYEMLTAQLPYEAGNANALMVMHIAAPAVPLMEAAPHLEAAPGLQRLIDRGLAKHPDERFRSASDYLARVEDLLPKERGGTGKRSFSDIPPPSSIDRRRVRPRKEPSSLLLDTRFSAEPPPTNWAVLIGVAAGATGAGVIVAIVVMYYLL